MKLSNSAFAILVVTAVAVVVFPFVENNFAFATTMLISGLVVGVRAFITPAAVAA